MEPSNNNRKSIEVTDIPPPMDIIKRWNKKTRNKEEQTEYKHPRQFNDIRIGRPRYQALDKIMEEHSDMEEWTELDKIAEDLNEILEVFQPREIGLQNQTFQKEEKKSII